MQVLTLVWIHFIADFILQSDKMALNKSQSLKWLAIHVGVYTLPLFYFGWKFALINGAAHLVVDYFTSKATAALWAQGRRHWFFVVIGLDQALHFSILFLTLGV